MYRSLTVAVNLNEITYYAKIVRIITSAFVSIGILPFILLLIIDYLLYTFGWFINLKLYAINYKNYIVSDIFELFKSTRYFIKI